MTKNKIKYLSSFNSSFYKFKNAHWIIFLNQKNRLNSWLIKLISSTIFVLFFNLGVLPTEIVAQDTEVAKKIAEIQEQINLLEKQKELIEAQSDLEKAELLGELNTTTETEVINAQTALEMLKKAQLEAETARINAEKALLNSQLPNLGTVTRLDGKTEIPNNGIKFESTILAYEALNQVSESVYRSLKNSSIDSLVIYNDSDDDNLIQILSNYRNYQTQIEILKLGYRAEGFSEPKLLRDIMNAPESGGGTNKESGIVGFGSALTVANSFLEAGINIAALFRVNREITEVTVSIPESALVSQLAAKFQNNSVKVNNTSESKQNDSSKEESNPSQRDTSASPGFREETTPNENELAKTFQCGVSASNSLEIY